jgi:predicted O-methyltransferase YrrM
MNPVLSRILATGAVTTGDGSTVPLHSAISADEGVELQRLIQAYRPQTTLEIGLAYGVSALFICEALTAVHGSRHIVIDPHQDEWGGLGLLNLERAGYGPLIECHKEPSHRVLPALEAAGRRVDFAFIDGWHTFDYVMVDFFYCDRLLNVGGVLVLEDTRWYPAIRKLARYIATHRRYTPLSDGPAPRVSTKRRLFGALTSPLRAPFMRRLTAAVVRPDVLEPDAVLGLPAGDLMAFVKGGDDVLGDGSAGSRRWDQHHEF